MGFGPNPSYTSLLRILGRQAGLPKWGADYLPSHFLSDPDTPKVTRPSEVFWPLVARYIQAQALTERPFILLALHCTWLSELLEQKMLPFNSAPHLLTGHPRAEGLVLPPMRGTLAIADEMGVLNRHPMVRAPRDHPISPNQLLPYPYVGDVLLVLSDLRGPYCKNWTIKKTMQDFERTFKNRNKPPSDEDKESAQIRFEIEKRCYLDGNIQTHALVPSMIDRELRINLQTLHYWWARNPESIATLSIEKEMLAWYREQIPKIRIQFDLANDGAKKFKTSVYDAKWVLKKGIFSRCLLVDLFQAVTDNLPLFPERESPFERYAVWFAREAL
ncbi:MAG: hypothetical protein H6R13_1802 [Proteobacteria bacterium]|nr:hypothetical protein [Pseudomonadota bacterium]